MSVVLALLSALAFGLSDFIGGIASRRASAWSVAVVVQVASAVSTAVLALFFGGTPDLSDIAWALLAGVGSGAGVGFLFRGFAAGRMSVVAPLSAVGAALVPVVLGLTLGERPGLLATVAIVAAFPGIWLVASGEDAGPPETPAGTPAGTPGGKPAGTAATRWSSGVGDGLLAGIGFGVLFAALAQVDDDAGLWPLTIAQAASAVAAAALATALRASWTPDRSTWRAVPAGPLSAVALLCFQLATQSGLLAVSAVLASLYPAATVLLAMTLLRERVRGLQTVGLALCAVTIALVALG